MDTSLDQLTYEISALERTLLRVDRELARIHRVIAAARTPSSTQNRRASIAAEISEMRMPVSDWGTMEREIYGD